MGCLRQMESSTSSLTFKGSIPEAIIEAQRKRKLFLVYISGKDENSALLEQTAWMDSNVAESISRHCVFLHLVHGTVEASQFLVIYPQKSVPSISAIGYNGGKLLWQHEGYVSPEKLVADIEKAWVNLHLQEATATVLTAAALASKNPESQSSNAVSVASVEIGSSSNSSVQASSMDKIPQGSETKSLIIAEKRGENTGPEPTVEVDQEYTKVDESTSQPTSVSECESGPAGRTISTNEAPITLSIENAAKTVIEPQGNSSIVTRESTTNDRNNASALGSADLPTNCVPDISQGSSMVTANEVKDSIQEKKIEGSVSCGNILKSKSSIASQESTSSDNNVISALGSADVVLTDCVPNISQGSSRITANEVEDSIQEKKSEGSISHGNIISSNDVHLNIRLPNGGSLQAKFSMTDTLRLVKNYVDENQMSGLDAYDLAIPYPRKVFNEQDMSKTLSELGFINREALIVVPHRLVSGRKRSQSSSHENASSESNTDSSADNGVGYFGYVRRMLSYMNPFAYFGGAGTPSSSEPASNDNLWQYRPNPALRNALSGAERSYHPYSPNLSSTSRGENVSKDNKATTAQFGGNIHTLKRDEDEGSSNDRNTFWNGNSTQYGGDNNQ